MRRSSLLLLGVGIVLAAGCGGTEKHDSGASSSTPTISTGTNGIIADSGDMVDGEDGGGSPPPAPDRRTIAWAEAKRLIAQCEVRDVFQAHSLHVELQLKDGGRRNTREPEIDDVLHLLDRAAGRCGHVGAAVE